MLMHNSMSKEKVLDSVMVCNKVANLYKNVLNSYVSDFYIESHWSLKLSNNWKVFLEKLNFTQIGDLLNYEKQSVTNVAPLTFLCLQRILKTYSVERKQEHVPEPARQDDMFLKYLWKNVKLKKRHEIEQMSKMCYQMAIKTDCFNIVDIGSGLGHLSRLLAFQYGFNICTFEANTNLVKLAAELDSQFKKILLAKKIPHKSKNNPLHVHKCIEETISSTDFELLIRREFKNNDDNFKFGMVGLHPCGNLGSTLLHLYNGSSNVTFINMVSCCYMKLSLEPPLLCGFPLSALYKEHNYKLDYLSCEIACHAIENYINKIKMIDHYHLKIHAYRAALEALLVKTNKNLRHCAINNVKYKKGMTFEEYCEKATKKYDLIFSSTDFDYYKKLIEESWTNVAKYHSVRLLLAPLVESVILYDRLLFLRENKSNCNIWPVFNCQISPRNHVLSAYKTR